MKKFIIFILLSICVSSVLIGCGTQRLPDTSDIKMDLDYYYSQRSCRIESIEIAEETLDKNNQEAYRTCTIMATAIDGSFRTTDSWEAFYIYHNKEGWELFNTTYISSDCELLTDLSEDDCIELLHGVLPSGIQVDSIVSDRENYTATATYAYTTKEDIFEEFGSLTTNITCRAEFSWDELNRWTLESVKESKEYTYDAAFNLQVEPSSFTLNSEKYWLSMDVKIEDNIPSLNVISYQGSIDTLGNLSISNAQLVKNIDDPGTIEITFDYIRDIENIKNDKNYSAYYDGLDAYYAAEGSGRLIISNNGSTRIHFYNWVLNGWWNKWEDCKDYASLR